MTEVATRWLAWMTEHPLYGFVITLSVILGTVAILRAFAKIFHRAPVAIGLSEGDLRQIRAEIRAAIVINGAGTADEDEADEDEQVQYPEEEQVQEAEEEPPRAVRQRRRRVRVPTAAPTSVKSRWDRLQADEV